MPKRKMEDQNNIATGDDLQCAVFASPSGHLFASEEKVGRLFYNTARQTNTVLDRAAVFRNLTFYSDIRFNKSHQAS